LKNLLENRLIKTSLTHPIRVDFAVVKNSSINTQIGMTFCPGKKQNYAITGQWNRDLSADLYRLKHTFFTKRLVCCVEDHEIEELQVTKLEKICKQLDIQLIKFPIVDTQTPMADSLTAFFSLHGEAFLKSNNELGNTVIFCKGGLGRTGLVAACLLGLTGLNANESMKRIRRARPGTIENLAQEVFVESFIANMNQTGI